MMTRKVFFQLLQKARDHDSLRIIGSQPTLYYQETCSVTVRCNGGFKDGKNEKWHMHRRTLANPLRKGLADVQVKYERWLEQWLREQRQ